ncbi:MAG: hypothetical protein HKN27_06490 [Silicimonas sp.]|nr:hypothetical protein [Silicimonas sp.]
MAQQPIFLERESYRRRRLGDAAKLLPVLGVVLFLMPLLWAGRGSTAGGLVFLFIAWAFLIFVMALLSRRLAETEPKLDEEAGSDDAV